MASRYDCDICQGAGNVRLPIHRRVMAFSADEAPKMLESHREYPCPECADVTRIERVQAVKEETFARSDINDPRFIEHVQESLCHQIAVFLMRNGYIRFDRSPDNVREMKFGMRAMVGVVRPNQLDNLEERIAERQTEVAQEVIAAAERGINNWGSYYGQQDISKDQATREVREALGAVLKKRAEWRPLPHPRSP